MNPSDEIALGYIHNYREKHESKAQRSIKILYSSISKHCNLHPKNVDMHLDGLLLTVILYF
uniref:Uncharacterized protein n=1 Tax=Arundo donax TaxID=35708 RepID=A0A0A8Z1C6_ARUDO